MSFTLSDIILENSIRRVLNQFRTAAQQPDAETNMNSTIIQLIDNLFDFTSTGALVRSVGPDGRPLPNTEFEGGIGATVSAKYTFERTRLIRFFRDNEIAIVHAFSDVQTHLPCVSIQLAADGEDQGLALTDDFGGIDGLTVVTAPSGSEFAMGKDINTIHANATVNVGIHTKEQLLTKYLYHVVKYAVLSNKEELIRQNFIIATFKGSDFSRDTGWSGDHVYTRFLNISGKTEDSWINVDEIVADVQQIDLQTYVGRETPDPMVQASEIQNHSSEVNSTINIGDTQIQVANVFGLILGMSTLLTTSVDTSVTPNMRSTVTDLINISAIDTTTNIITIDSTLMNQHPVGTVNNIFSTTYVFNGMGDTILLSQVVQTIPTPSQTSVDRVTNNDADGVVHRTTTSS